MEVNDTSVEELPINFNESAPSTSDTAPEQQVYLQRPFDAVEHGLSSDFRLSKFTDLQIMDMRIPEDVRTAFEGILTFDGDDDTYVESTHTDKLLNVFVEQLHSDGLVHLFTVTATEFLYSFIDDPYLMGKIAAANVLNNMYALGVTDCQTVIAKAGVPLNMTDQEKDIILPLLFGGFKDLVTSAGAQVPSTSMNENPWCFIGGTANSVCEAADMVKTDCAVAGDVLVLTKPLGTYLALTAYRWMEVPERWSKLRMILTEDDAHKAFQRALDSMGRLNALSAKMMHKYAVHASTIISSYGLLGHANSLACHQKNEVTFIIHNLPIILKMSAVCKASGTLFDVHTGKAPEISGGLLICLPREQAASFCKDVEKLEGYPSWIIGIVEKGERIAKIIDKPRVIDVPARDKEGELW